MTPTAEDLATVVEQDHAPNRDKFREIYAACHGGRLFDDPATDGFIATHAKWNRFAVLIEAGAWFDAAMSLIPEGMRDEIEITTLYCVARVTINMNHGDDGCPFYGSNEANSIPLAICAAALRAQGGQHDR